MVKRRLQNLSQVILFTPQVAIDNCISGFVTVQCIIEKDGSISDETTLVKGIGYGCDEEALRVIKSMPKWSPAKQSGELVRTYWRIPIKFELPADCTPVLEND